MRVRYCTRVCTTLGNARANIAPHWCVVNFKYERTRLYAYKITMASIFVGWAWPLQTHLIGWNINTCLESSAGLNSWAYVRAYACVYACKNVLQKYEQCSVCTRTRAYTRAYTRRHRQQVWIHLKLFLKLKMLWFNVICTLRQALTTFMWNFTKFSWQNRSRISSATGGNVYSDLKELTQCGNMVPYSIIKLGQRWLR